jgi:hypothetical protein
MEGYKSWTGLVIIVLGFLGLGTIATQDQIGTLIDLGTQFVGICITIYGVWDKQKRLDSALNK